jgi:hypothetical protein
MKEYEYFSAVISESYYYHEDCSGIEIKNDPMKIQNVKVIIHHRNYYENLL